MLLKRLLRRLKNSDTLSFKNMSDFLLYQTYAITG